MSRREENVERLLKALSHDIPQVDDDFKSRLILTLRQELLDSRRNLACPKRWMQHCGLRWVVVGLFVALLAGLLITVTPKHVTLTVQQGPVHVVLSSFQNLPWGRDQRSHTIGNQQNVSIGEGAQIVLPGESTAVLSLFKGSRVELSPGTQMTLTKAHPGSVLQAATVQMQVEVGEVRAEVAHLKSPNERFEVTMPSASIRVRGTVFRARVITATHTYVATDEGVVSVILNDPAHGNPAADVPAGYEVEAIVGQPLVVRPQMSHSLTNTVLASGDTHLFTPQTAVEMPTPVIETPSDHANPTPQPTPISAPREPRIITPTVTTGLTVTTGITVTVPITGAKAPFTDTVQNPDDDIYPVGAIPAVNPKAKLALTQTAAPDVAFAGEHLTYTLRVTNDGPSEARGLVVTDSLPSEVVFVRAVPPPDAISGPLIWRLGTLAAGQSYELRVGVRVRSWVTQSFTATATVSSATPDDDRRDNRAVQLTRIVPTSDLAITRVDAPIFIEPGDVVTYALTYMNLGPTTAHNVKVTVTLPSVAHFGANVNIEPPMKFNVTTLLPQDQETLSIGTLTALTWSTPTLLVGAVGHIVFTSTVHPDALGNMDAKVSISSATPDHYRNNNRLHTNTTITHTTDLAIAHSNAPPSVIAGEVLTYTLVYTNRGSQSAENVIITHTLPPSTTFGGMVHTPPELHPLTQTTRALVWSEPLLRSGVSRTLAFTVTTAPPMTKTLSAVTFIDSATPDADMDNNKAIVATAVLSPDLALKVTVTPARVVPLMPFTYTIHLTNTGTLSYAPETLTIVNWLPPAIYPITDTGGGYASSQRVLTWHNVAPLTPTRSLSISFVVLSTQAISQDAYTNTVKVMAALPVGSMSVTDVVSVIVTAPSLVIQQQMEKCDGGEDASSTVTFTIHFTNTGPSALDVLPLVDHYDPARLHFVNAYPSPDLIDEGMLSWRDLTGSLSDGFDHALLPHEGFSITATFAALQDAGSQLAFQNSVTVTKMTDIYNNQPVEDIGLTIPDLRHLHIPLVTRRY